MTDSATHPHPHHAHPVVLIVEDDADIGNLVSELLTDEGYAVALLPPRRVESVADTIERISPACVLLDGDARGSYSQSWADAASMAAMPAPAPVIMFSADQGATTEARLNLSERSRAARFAAVIAKPFEIDDLLRVIAEAVRHRAGTTTA